MYNYKKIADYLANLDNNTSIYITGHKNPDYDSICSCVSLCKALTYLGKKANVLLANEQWSILDWSNTKFCFKENIEEQNYVFIALDLNDLDRLGVYEKQYLNAKIKINIDHHVGNTTNADVLLSLPKLSSTCEMVYNIIEKLNKNIIDNSISELLYAGIMTDTNGFSRRLTNKTLIIAQKLINNGIDYSHINKATHTTRTEIEYKALAYLINHICYCNNFCYVIADKSLEIFKNLSINSLNKKVAEDLRKLNFLHTCFIITLNLDKSITCKVMTDKTSLIPANEIATHFGGGGHKNEAGFTVKNISPSELIDKLDKYLNKNY